MKFECFECKKLTDCDEGIILHTSSWTSNSSYLVCKECYRLLNKRVV